MKATPAQVAAFVKAAGALVAAGVDAYDQVHQAVAAVAGAREAQALAELRAGYLARAARAAARAQEPPA